MYRLSGSMLNETFAHFRGCGRGRRECQVLWVSPWDAPNSITRVVHSKHLADTGSILVDNGWLNDFWNFLAQENTGVRLQVHTHPGEAFHSPTDDNFPIVHTTGFLSLVIPNFALGSVGFDGAYLAEIQADGRWREVAIAERLVVT
jgi:hypothetical protein